PVVSCITIKPSINTVFDSGVFIPITESSLSYRDAIEFICIALNIFFSVLKNKLEFYEFRCQYLQI
ncbi:MAG: hypothetical protein PWK00_10025, partial [Coxiella burnetii]|nr:hypothetical protein [Coxiella burnetii]